MPHAIQRVQTGIDIAAIHVGTKPRLQDDGGGRHALQQVEHLHHRMIPLQSRRDDVAVPRTGEDSDRRLDSGRNLVVLGDLNTEAGSPHVAEFCEVMGLRAPTRGLATYPSWQPQRAIDHILVSERLRSGVAEVFDLTFSDHCPVALEIELPDALRLEPATRPVVSVQSNAAPQGL